MKVLSVDTFLTIELPIWSKVKSYDPDMIDTISTVVECLGDILLMVDGNKSIWIKFGIGKYLEISFLDCGMRNWAQSQRRLKIKSLLQIRGRMLEMKMNRIWSEFVLENILDEAIFRLFVRSILLQIPAG